MTMTEIQNNPVAKVAKIFGMPEPNATRPKLLASFATDNDTSVPNICISTFEFVSYFAFRISCFIFLSSFIVPRSSFADEGADFFEKKIRPVLVERCYSCHSAEAETLEGELLLDNRAGWMSGGASGQIIVPGEPEKSLLLHAMKWKNADLEMPPEKKLPDDVLADFEKWIEMGAPDPRTEQTGGYVGRDREDGQRPDQQRRRERKRQWPAHAPGPRLAVEDPAPLEQPHPHPLAEGLDLDPRLRDPARTRLRRHVAQVVAQEGARRRPRPLPDALARGVVLDLEHVAGPAGLRTGRRRADADHPAGRVEAEEATRAAAARDRGDVAGLSCKVT